MRSFHMAIIFVFLLTISSYQDLRLFVQKTPIHGPNQFWDSLDFQTFEDILALLIYGLVLFPNSDAFGDVNAVKIFEILTADT